MDTLKNGPYIPTTIINKLEHVKVKGCWNEYDKKKGLFDKKAKNILVSALGMNELFCVSNCKISKEIWNALEVTHKGKVELKRLKLNTLSQEYEMIIMQSGESILDLKKTFSHLTNHLIALGKTFTNDKLNLKVLRLFTRALLLNVTTIS